jgi:hypothetical protein
MSTNPITIPDLVRGLILLSGISQQEAAVRSGVSPGSVVALCERTPKQLQTWLRLVAALGGQIEVACRDRSFRLALPRLATPLLEREWRSWRQRRMVTTINHLRHAEPRTKRLELEARARSYAANEEERLRLRLRELRAASAQLADDASAQGMRAALQLLAERLSLKAEELSLLAGVSLSACQLALGETHDGRLGTLHRLLSALEARLTVLLPQGRLALAPCPPGEWRPGMVEPEDNEAWNSKPLAGIHSASEEPHRSQLPAETILTLYDQGRSIGEIARQAGVSRQRVHKLAMDSGRPHRRALAREERIERGRVVLGLG